MQMFLINGHLQSLGRLNKFAYDAVQTAQHAIQCYFICCFTLIKTRCLDFNMFFFYMLIHLKSWMFSGSADCCVVTSDTRAADVKITFRKPMYCTESVHIKIVVLLYHVQILIRCSFGENDFIQKTMLRMEKSLISVSPYSSYRP